MVKHRSPKPRFQVRVLVGPQKNCLQKALFVNRYTLYVKENCSMYKIPMRTTRDRILITAVKILQNKGKMVPVGIDLSLWIIEHEENPTLRSEAVELLKSSGVSREASERVVTFLQKRPKIPLIIRKELKKMILPDLLTQ